MKAIAYHVEWPEAFCPLNSTEDGGMTPETAFERPERKG